MTLSLQTNIQCTNLVLMAINKTFIVYSNKYLQCIVLIFLTTTCLRAKAEVKFNLLVIVNVAHCYGNN